MRAILMITAGIFIMGGCSREQAPSPSQSSPSSETSMPAEKTVAKPSAPQEVEKQKPPQSRPDTQGPYTVDTGADCDGFPRLNLKPAAGLCAGLVATKDTPALNNGRGLTFPRDILIPNADHRFDREVLITDMGGWGENKGRLLFLNRGKIETVLSGLNLPHAIEYGPDGHIYLAEADKIIRVHVPPAKSDGYASEDVITGLPYKTDGKLHLHPLKAFTFEDENTILINSGSVSDRCADSLKNGVCPQNGDTASVLKFIKTASGWTRSDTFKTTGLRNSMGLTTHASGTILQAGNGTDYKEADRPPEELNIIKSAGFYGWPYCYGREQADPDWANLGYDCTEKNPDLIQPVALLPAHGAPLDLLYAPPGTLGFKTEKLLIPLHGYRPAGHRILVMDIDKNGHPAGTAKDLLYGWDAGPTGPKGAPVGLTLGPNGTVWGVEDKNKTVFRISRDTYLPQAETQSSSESAQALNPKFAAVHAGILKPQCAACHSELSGTAEQAQQKLKTAGWIGSKPDVDFYERLIAEPPRQMPPQGRLSAPQLAAIQDWLDNP